MTERRKDNLAEPEQESVKTDNVEGRSIKMQSVPHCAYCTGRQQLHGLSNDEA